MVMLNLWVVMLNLVGGLSLSVTALTSNLCGFVAQSTLVQALGRAFL